MPAGSEGRRDTVIVSDWLVHETADVHNVVYDRTV